MVPDPVSNPGPLTYESGALPIALRGPAGRYVTLYFEGSQLPHLKMNWNLNHKGLINWASDNYKYYHSCAEPQPTLYEVTSDSKYTRKQFHDTVIHYWKELKPKLKSSNTHFFPRN